ncbi:MAG: molybdopterin converting factor subunit 1 [Pseudomonadota bacterium]
MSEVTVKYFAWLRERVGVPEEQITLPRADMTIADLIAHLSERGENYAYAFADQTIVRAAIDQMHADHADPIEDAREIALFPPMTGG